jgi:hypothetical protein
MDGRWLGRLRLVGAAIGGAAVGHVLIYLVTVPDPHTRGMVLAETGHGYWSMAVGAAVMFGLLSAGATIARHCARGWHRARPSGGQDRLRQLAGQLAVLQAGIYMTQEVLERLAAGAPLTGLAQHQLLTLGIPVQLLIGVGVAAVLTLLGRTAEAVGWALSCPPPPEPTRLPTVRPLLPPRATRCLAGPAAIRAPPGLRLLLLWRAIGSVGT